MIAELRNKINMIISEILHTPIEDVTPEKRFLEDFNMDSLDFVDAIIQIERNFGINIPDVEAANALRVQDIYNIVERQINDTSN